MTQTWSFSTGEPTVRSGPGKGGLMAGFWQRSSGAKIGVGSDNIATAEFQLPETAPSRVRSASYQFSGRASQCAGAEAVVFDVYAYAADGKPAIADAGAGSRVAQLTADCKDNPAFARPIDVTALVRQLAVPAGIRHVGFSIRKANHRQPPSYFSINPGKLTVVLTDESVAAARPPTIAPAPAARAPAPPNAAPPKVAMTATAATPPASMPARPHPTVSRLVKDKAKGAPND